MHGQGKWPNTEHVWYFYDLHTNLFWSNILFMSKSFTKHEIKIAWKLTIQSKICIFNGVVWKLGFPKVETNCDRIYKTWLLKNRISRDKICYCGLHNEGSPAVDQRWTNLIPRVFWKSKSSSYSEESSRLPCAWLKNLPNAVTIENEIAK